MSNQKKPFDRECDECGARATVEFERLWYFCDEHAHDGHRVQALRRLFADGERDRDRRASFVEFKMTSFARFVP